MEVAVYLLVFLLGMLLGTFIEHKAAQEPGHFE